MPVTDERKRFAAGKLAAEAKEVYMKYIRRFLLSLFALLILSTAYVESASAQTRRVVYVRRPVVVRNYVYRNPYWYSRSWYSPYWYGRNWMWDSDPYFYDPYLREQRERYYREKDVRDRRKDLSKDREKYLRDGVITFQEREKLDKQARKLAKAIAKLNDLNRNG